MSIALSIGNNLTTSGVFTNSAVNNTSVGNVTSFASVPAGGQIILVSTQTASSSASISFTSNIDSTYDSYLFEFINLHPENDGRTFRVEFSADGGSSFKNVATTFYNALHSEDDSSYALVQREDSLDTNNTTPATLISSVGNDNDDSISGSLRIFDPSNSAHSTSFTSRIISAHDQPMVADCNVSGYVHDAAAINALKFTFNTGNIDSGKIKMYGVK